MNDRVDISESSIKDPSMNSFSAQEAVGKGERTPVVQALERILTPEQRQLIQTEKEIGLLGLDEHAKIILPRAGEDNDAVLAWKAKEGVLDAKSYQGVTMVIFRNGKSRRV